MGLIRQPVKLPQAISISAHSTSWLTSMTTTSSRFVWGRVMGRFCMEPSRRKVTDLGLAQWWASFSPSSIWGITSRSLIWKLRTSRTPSWQFWPSRPPNLTSLWDEICSCYFRSTQGIRNWKITIELWSACAMWPNQCSHTRRWPTTKSPMREQCKEMQWFLH